jgi:hypothetical protein
MTVADLVDLWTQARGERDALSGAPKETLASCEASQELGRAMCRHTPVLLDCLCLVEEIARKQCFCSANVDHVCIHERARRLLRRVEETP